jgi:putative SOS response-associated peptidase YedK
VSGDEIAELFDASPIDVGPARYNIAPTQPMLTVRAREDMRQLAQMRWGLIPWWARPEEAKKIGSRCIQARAETANRMPAFRDSFRNRRCLVVIDGFFEWKTLPDGRRVPHHMRKRSGEPFAVAGLWDSWHDRTEAPRIESCAVLTTRAGGHVRDVHDRMPLLLAPSEYDTWLGASPDPAAELLSQDPARLERRADELVIIPVSTWVNDVKHDDPRCVEPAIA